MQSYLQPDHSLSVRQILLTVEHLAMHDPLTGVYNQRFMRRMIVEELQRCQQYYRPMSLLLCQADQLSAVRDQYGPVTGDSLLVQLADRLNQIARTLDRLGRASRDQFWLLMPETPLEQAERIAERLCQVVKGTPLHTSHRVHYLTLSAALIGDIDWFPHQFDELTGYIQQLLREAICAGGNQVQTGELPGKI